MPLLQCGSRGTDEPNGTAAISPSAGRPYGLARVARTWRIARSTIYAQLHAERARSRAAAEDPQDPWHHQDSKRGPKTAHTDTELVSHVQRVLAESQFTGEGHRKVWAKLRMQGVRTSKVRVLRLMRENGLLAPTRSPRVRGPYPHDGTITTERPNEMWGTDATTVLTGEGTATVFIDDSFAAPFGSGHYATVDSYGRQPFYQNTSGSGPDASPQCDHETRLANIAAAPRDGIGVVGIAYRANVYSNYFEDGVYNTDEAAASAAVYYIGVYAHAKVITMAWGSLTGNSGISDTIDNLYYNYDVMFVGAAGTCWGGTGYCPNMGSAVFPASKGEVLAATGANWDGSRPTDNYDWGANFEGVLTYTTLATVGLGSGTASDLGGSSASTGVIAGVAALVRSRYPWLNAHDAMYRILNTDGAICRDPPPAWRPGMVNALAAVGGPCILQINGPTTINITAPTDYATADYSVTVIGDNSANYTYSWSTQHPGNTTTAYFYANGWTPYQSYVTVTATDPATGASVTRTLSIYMNSTDGSGGACGRTYC